MTARQDPVAFHGTQGDGDDAPADTADGAPELSEPGRPVAEMAHDEPRQLVPEDVQHLAGPALVVRGHGYLLGTGAPESALSLRLDRTHRTGSHTVSSCA